MSETTVRAAFELQASWARQLGAGFSARLIDRLAHIIDRSTAVGVRLLDWSGDPVADALVLRLLGGLHALVRAGAQPDLAAIYPALGAAATPAAPLAWLRFKFEGAGSDLPTLRLRLWPGGDDRRLAHAHPHGASITWLG